MYDIISDFAKTAENITLKFHTKSQQDIVVACSEF